MKLLLVISVDPWTRSVATVHKWVEAGRACGHDVVVFGKPHPDLPQLPFTTDVDAVDLALFAIQLPLDFPDMPYLARLLDGIPRERRVVVDLWGRYNDTIRIERDFNHLQRFDGHLDWEWEEAIRAVSDVILQPTLAPLRPDVGSFLFHGFDAASVVPLSRDEAKWRAKPYGLLYVGSNWQRWDQIRHFLDAYGTVQKKVGRACLVGWNWNPPRDEAARMIGINSDPDFLVTSGIEVRDGVRFDEVVSLLGQARFAPVFHRPLFKHLGFVTVRTFETFYADAIPVLMLPPEQVAAIYGEAALKLVPDDDLAAHLAAAIDKPRPFWDAVVETRDHLARHHSFAKRFQDLEMLVKTSSPPGAAV